MKVQKKAQKEQQKIDKQLQAETKRANKKPRKKPIQKASPKEVVVAEKSTQNDAEVVFVCERGLEGNLILHRRCGRDLNS